MLARIAALIAVDAPPASYLANAAAASDFGLTAEDLQGVMVAVAPVVGTARVVSAGGNILRALGLAIAVADAELADGDGGSVAGGAAMTVRARRWLARAAFGLMLAAVVLCWRSPGGGAWR